MRRLLPVVAVAILAVGCSSSQIKPAEVNPTDMPKGPGLLSGKSGNLLNAFNNSSKAADTGGQIGVNIFLWRAALESLAFMPIQTADSNGGIITTDWYSAPERPAERVKVTVLILGKSLRPDALKINLFRQTKTEGGWSNAEASASTARALEDTILTKARALRVQSLATAD